MKKLKEEKIEFKSGSTDIEIDTTQNEGKLIWSKNLGLITDAKGNIIRYCNIDSLEQFNQKNIPAYTFYDGDISNGEKYGKLYNFHAVMDERGLAPKGWHVPSKNEYETLISFLGGKYEAGNKMRSTKGWDVPDKKYNDSDEYINKYDVIIL